MKTLTIVFWQKWHLTKMVREGPFLSNIHGVEQNCPPLPYINCKVTTILKINLLVFNFCSQYLLSKYYHF